MKRTPCGINMSELQAGWIVQIRDGDYLFVIIHPDKSVHFVNKGQWLSMYEDDLLNYASEDFDVIKVFKPEKCVAESMSHALDNIEHALYNYYLEVTIAKPKLSLNQVKEILGYDFDLLTSQE